MKVLLSIVVGLLLLPSIVFAQVGDEGTAVDPETSDTIVIEDETPPEEAVPADEELPTPSDAPRFNFTIVNEPPEEEVVEETNIAIDTTKTTSPTTAKPATAGISTQENIMVLAGWLIVIIMFVAAGYLTYMKSQNGSKKGHKKKK